MTWVALLRGINVGGHNKVEMSRLKATFERIGLEEVRTYIASGNVVFRTPLPGPSITSLLEAAIEEDFGFHVKVLVRSADEMAAVAAVLPDAWQNDATAKCDVMFLDPSLDAETVLGELRIKPGIDEVRAAPGAILWHVDRALVTRSGLLRIVGTPLHASMTVRNSNTFRKLHAMMGGG